MSLSFLLDSTEDLSLSTLKSIKLKKSLIKLMALNGVATIAELSKETDFSIPTVTKVISELIGEGIVSEDGKAGTPGGRRPSQYGINPKACYYLGVEVKLHSVNIGIQDFNNNFVHFSENVLVLETIRMRT